MDNNGISVVIPNYNGRQLLEEILPPLFIALNNTGLNYEVIITDDCSIDDSVSLLKQKYPSIIILQNEINKGFSPTINKGIFASQYSYVLLLNNDVKLSENYFASLLHYFDKKDTFGVMGRIIGWKDDNIQDAAKYPSFHLAKIKTSGNYLALQPKKDDWLYSMYLSGANAFVSRNKLLELGGFDELFAPFYVEDYELSLRAWRLGWKCYYDHFAVCRHQTSASIKSKSSKKYINTIYYRNKMYLHAIHLSGCKLALWYLQLIPETLIKIFILRFYYFNSLKIFFQNKKKINESKQKFLHLSKQKNILLSVKQVFNSIIDSLKNRDIKIF